MNFRFVQKSLFSTSSRQTNALRALVYHKNGNPAEVLRAQTFEPLGKPGPSQVRVKVLLSPINPADINVVEGKYPEAPILRSDLVPEGGANSSPGYDREKPVFVGGNEAVGVVTDAGTGVQDFKAGDRVIFDKSQLGAWATYQNLEAAQLAKVDDDISDVAAATMRINPPSALIMLRSFTALKPGDWIIQNGANSAVGQAVIQVAAALGVNTINLVRNRPDINELMIRLHALGGTRVLTYNELADKAMKQEVKKWTQGKPIKLGLNCVGGKDTTIMTGYLGKDAHLVSYGAMSKSPISLPTSYFIFKNLTCHGHWQSRWYNDHSKADRLGVYAEIMDLIRQKKLKVPEHEILELKGSDSEVTRTLAHAMQKLSAGSHGKKILLKWASDS
ncbi:mitochondrial 2-enoyl thioester reductase [Tulasnella sp. 417]|nr:mitochondrial 2-enoyl thioester reductase [Tulasnella sp. 417]